MTKARNYYQRINDDLDSVIGASPVIEDRLFWLPSKTAEWYEALEAIDERGDPGPLLALLAVEAVPEDVHPHLVDLFKRKKLVNKGAGRPATPSYDATPADKALLTALVRVGMYIDDFKMKPKAAIDRVSRELKVSDLLLAAVVSGKRTIAHREFARVKFRANT